MSGHGFLWPHWRVLVCTLLQDKKGKNVFPIIPLYEKMPILGQLFTASYCNDERMATIAEITDGQYTAGSIIWLQDNPPEEMITILHDIGYTCSGGTEGTCTKWRLAETSIDPQKILQLRSFSQKITDDACVYCK